MTELHHDERPGEDAVVLQSELPPDESLESPDIIDVLSAAGQGLTSKPLSPGRLAWRRFRRHKPALVSAAVLVILAIVVFFPHLLTSKDPLRSSDVTKAVPPSWAHPAGPTASASTSCLESSTAARSR